MAREYEGIGWSMSPIKYDWPASNNRLYASQRLNRFVVTCGYGVDNNIYPDRLTYYYHVYDRQLAKEHSGTPFYSAKAALRKCVGLNNEDWRSGR